MFNTYTPIEMKELRQRNFWLEAFGLSDDDFYQVIILGTRAMIESDSLEVFYQKMTELIKKDQSTSKKLIEAVVNHRFLEHREEITGFEDFVKKFDLKLQDPEEEMELVVNGKTVIAKKENETPEEFVTRILSELDISFPDHVQQSRLEFILVSLLKGERTADETVAAFIRPLKVGGLEMEAENAKLFLARFLEKTEGVNFTNPVLTTPTSTPIPTRPTMFRDIRPLAQVPSPIITPLSRRSLPQAKADSLSPAPPAHVAHAAPASTAQPPLQPLPASPTNNHVNLQNQENQGSDNQSDTAEILQATQTIKEKISPVIKPILSTNDAVEKVIAETDLKLDESGQKKLSAIIDARLKDVRDAFETRNALERAVEQGGLAITGLQLAKTMELLENIVNEQQTKMRAESDQNKKAIKENKIAEEARKKTEAKAVIQAAKPKIMPKPIIPTMNTAPATQSARPIFTDIVPPVRKLSGPIDELQKLTLEEFRRLSSDPKEIILKIKDKIDLLEEQGMGQKILGIKAWHLSPVNRLYLEITKTALISGKTTDEISAERSGLNQETLSPAEVKAINELNGSLRF